MEQVDLVSLARAKLSAGNGPEALQIVMHIIRSTRGEQAVFDTLAKMKAVINEKEATDKLCAQIEEVLSINDSSIDAERLCRILENQTTLLSERGDEDILRDAFEDGSSVVCTICGDLIARVRWKQHRDLWCSGNCKNDCMDTDSD